MDTSSTALIAPVTYRMAVFENDTSLISCASHALKFVQNNVDADGRLQNIVTVIPIMFHGPLPPAEHSPEGHCRLAAGVYFFTPSSLAIIILSSCQPVRCHVTSHSANLLMSCKKWAPTMYNNPHKSANGLGDFQITMRYSTSSHLSFWLH